MKYKGGFGENTRTLYAGAAAPRTYFKAELWGADDLNQCYGCGTWGDEGLAEAHDELDHGREEERLLTRLGMSEYYGSEGFGPLAAGPPPDVCSYGAWRLFRR
jgi:hypothetical protein